MCSKDDRVAVQQPEREPVVVITDQVSVVSPDCGPVLGEPDGEPVAGAERVPVHDPERDPECHAVAVALVLRPDRGAVLDVADLAADRDPDLPRMLSIQHLRAVACVQGLPPLSVPRRADVLLQLRQRLPVLRGQRLRGSERRHLRHPRMRNRHPDGSRVRRHCGSDCSSFTAFVTSYCTTVCSAQWQA